jgi:DNA-binding response OmpR family regulator
MENRKLDGLRLMIVDDEEDIRDILQFNLESEGFLIDTAASAEAAVQMLSPEHRLIILDVMMGGMSGFKMADRLRKEGNDIPIIFLTAKDTENDMLTGFSIGADDYISKPFSIKEVIARVKSLLKRSGANRDASPIIKYKGLKIDTKAMSVEVNGEQITLTRTEYNILLLMMTNEDEFFSRSVILDRAWGNDSIVVERTVDVHITRLRRKIGEYSDCIVSRPGYGYMFTTRTAVPK